MLILKKVSKRQQKHEKLPSMLRDNINLKINATVKPVLTLYFIMTPLKYHVFENIMENGAFAPKLHIIFKSIQNLT